MRSVRAAMHLVLALLVTLMAGNTYGVAQTYNQKAAAGVAKLQSWYSSSTGGYASPSGWWNWANSITVLADYERITDDNSYYSVLSNTFSVTPGAEGHPNFTNNYYDDMGWWALAWISAYDTTGNMSYLSTAETIFSKMAAGWEATTCGGGIWWNTSRTYKNAIANELFLEVAAKLANRTTGSTSTTYLNWAKEEWNWFKASGMINSSNLVNDGLNSSNPSACVNNGGTKWTYNQGVILGGLVELYEADQDSTLLPKAKSIANAVLSSNLVNANGILVEPAIRGGDSPQFKGIFIRNLRALYLAAPNPTYQRFIGTNANSIWAYDQGSGYEFGALWQGEFDFSDATRQASALDALISAIAVQGSAVANSNPEKRLRFVANVHHRR